ncbi:biotin-dependent carboxyltransferase family protein [Pseudonocardia acaciae]|uniref:5-oxoprolinase subunit C family protein n=1 Tax=Pseudonocardia acaciae TaxID=551276 RepID=UPI00068643E7|nr:biotin-dependent carboxyltransferase family protein [Pseudonocardia acaciae]
MSAPGGSYLVVHHPGPLSTVQDLGRAGWAALGVPPSGASDSRSLTLANRLVGNPEHAACVEASLGGLTVELTAARHIALTGAHTAADLAGRPVAANTPYYARPGDVLRLGRPLGGGLRTYLAVSGGIAVDPTLGSRSTDLLAGLGPPPLRPGHRLPLGDQPSPRTMVDLAPSPALPARPVLDVVPGPRDDWFTPDGLATLTGNPYTVTADANRVGVRLDGPALTRRVTAELGPEGMPTGALQVPPSGQPILFLTDHPATGGYPVIAVVTTRCLPLAGQLAPGDTVSFRFARGADEF